VATICQGGADDGPSDFATKVVDGLMSDDRQAADFKDRFRTATRTASMAASRTEGPDGTPAPAEPQTWARLRSATFIRDAAHQLGAWSTCMHVDFDAPEAISICTWSNRCMCLACAEAGQLGMWTPEKVCDACGAKDILEHAACALGAFVVEGALCRRCRQEMTDSSLADLQQQVDEPWVELSDESSE
jgi:hypothetical protein